MLSTVGEKQGSRREFLAGIAMLAPGARNSGCGSRAAPERLDPPFENSTVLRGMQFTGRHHEYTNADTWFPTWGADGHLYSPWTDGYILEGVQDYMPFRQEHPEYACNSVDFMGRKAATAQARIEGDDPMELRIVTSARAWKLHRRRLVAGTPADPSSTGAFGITAPTR